MKMIPQIDDQVILRCRSATLAAVVRDVTRAAGRSDTSVVLRPVHVVPKRYLPAGEVVTLNDAVGTTWRGVIGGSTDRAVLLLLDKAIDDAVDLTLVRADLLSRAKLAKHYKKNDVMLSAINAIGQLHQELSAEELELTLWSYTSFAQKQLEILKSIQSLDTTDIIAETPESVVVEFYHTVKDILLKHCIDCIKQTEDHLIPFSSQEKRAVYYRLIGDLSWVAADFIYGDRDRMLAKAVSCYEIAIDVWKSANFATGSATFLGLVLNLSVILHDLLNSCDRACYMASEAVTATSPELLSPKSRTAFNFINDNLRTWLSSTPVGDIAIPDIQKGGAARHLLRVEAQVEDALPVSENAKQEVEADAAVADPPLVEVPMNANEVAEAVVGQPVDDPLDGVVANQLENANQDAPEVQAVVGQPIDDQEGEDGAVADQLDNANHDVEADDPEGEDGAVADPVHLVNQDYVELHLDPFVSPLVDWEKPGNCYQGKNYRDARKKKSEEKGRYG